MIYDQEDKLTNEELIGKIEGTYNDSNMNDWEFLINFHPFLTYFA